MAFAGEGSPGMGLSAMFWNPAAVTQTEDAQVETHLTGVFPQMSIQTSPGTSAQLMSLGNSSVSIGQPALLGAFYAGYNYDQHLYFGIATGSPFGLRTSAALPWPGQNLSLRAQAKSFEGNPIVGYRVNGILSVAAGLRVIWVQTGFSRAILPSVQNPNVAELDASDVALGWNLGATLTPWTGTELALGYRSAVDVSLGGRTVLPPVAPLSGAFGVNGRATLPDQVNLGIRQRLGPSLTLLGTVEWTNWSRMQNVPFAFTNGPATGATATTLTLNYRNGWYFAVGGEYQWSAETTFRAGVGYEVSPVTSGVRDPSLPYNDGWRLSAGMTHQFSPSITFDVGYSYIVVKDAPINVVPGHPDFADLLGSSFVAVGKQRFSMVSLALRYKFRT
jgi:long-chain fatty acid transport protein